ncbi:MAG TPA: DUF805 domain-containing protein, partial [Gemmatimonadales bacterium]|nr:DUF805 domain-containing protein [Gemmatimonadales bacterium]
MADLFRFWFGWVTPVGRRRYFLHGAGLMVFKYFVDAGVIWLATGVVWTPLDYFDPVWSLRAAALGQGHELLAFLLAIWTLPFLWIGVSLSMRRALDAGRSAWGVIVFFIPGFNYLLMLVLSVLPSRPARPDGPPRTVDPRLRSALYAVAAGLAITIPTVLLALYERRFYSLGLFLGTPFTLGAICAHVYNRRNPGPFRKTVPVVLLTVMLLGLVLVLFALEGVVCIAMAFPIAAMAALAGAILGRAIAMKSSEMGASTGMA